MMKYREQMKADIMQAIKDNYTEALQNEDREELEEKLNDELFTDDSVTGNASGSYFFNRAKAREMVLADGIDYLQEAAREGLVSEMDIGTYFLRDDWESMDVIIRCYLLGSVISEVLDEIM